MSKEFGSKESREAADKFIERIKNNGFKSIDEQLQMALDSEQAIFEKTKELMILVSEEFGETK